MLVGVIAVCGFVGELLGDAIRHPIEDRQQIIVGGTAQPQQRQLPGVLVRDEHVIDASAAHGGLPAGKDPEFSCTVSDGKSQFTITMYVRVTPKNKTERIVRVAWEIFPDGLFDADAFPDEKQTSKTIRLQKLEHVVRISKTIIGGK